VVKRAPIFAVGQSIKTKKEVPLSYEILDAAASAVLLHIALTKEAKADERTPLERFGAIIGNSISNGVDRASRDSEAMKALQSAPLLPAESNHKPARA
jgi:hypothetical protein